VRAVVRDEHCVYFQCGACLHKWRVLKPNVVAPLEPIDSRD
jgi:hypothetical protein